MMEDHGFGSWSQGEGGNPQGWAAPSPNRETPETGFEKQSVGKGVVFVDFGRNKVYALTDDSDEVSVFDDFAEMFERLRPTTIVADTFPRKLLPVIAGLADEVTFLRLKNLGKVAEIRKQNGLRKNDENDVKLLRQLFHKHPEAFQPLFSSPEELEVRELTELLVEVAGMKKAAKNARKSTKNKTAVKVHRTLRRLIDELSTEIHEVAMSLPLYRRAFEELGLKGPTLAYIISHDGLALTTLPRDRLDVRYQMTERPWRKRPLRSQLLIKLANVAVLHKHPRYLKKYEYYRQKGKKRWQCVVKVARIILRDLAKLAKTAQKAGSIKPDGEKPRRLEWQNLSSHRYMGRRKTPPVFWVL